MQAGADLRATVRRADLRDLQVGLALAGPGEEAAGRKGAGHRFRNLVLIEAADQFTAMAEEQEFFFDLAPARRETLVVRTAYIGEQAVGAVDDGGQMRHFSHRGNAGLEQAEFVFGFHLPKRKRNARLRVEAFGAAHDPVVVLQQLEQPFLDDGLAVAARDPHDRIIEAVPVMARQALQGPQGIVDQQKGSLRIQSEVYLPAYYKKPNPLPVGVADEGMPVAPGSAQRKEQRSGREYHLPAVEQ